jgi:hypothetical protein
LGAITVEECEERSYQLCHSSSIQESNKSEERASEEKYLMKCKESSHAHVYALEGKVFQL